MKPALRIVCSMHSRTIAEVVYEDGRAIFKPKGSPTVLYTVVYEDGRSMITAGSLGVAEIDSGTLRGPWFGTAPGSTPSRRDRFAGLSPGATR